MERGQYPRLECDGFILGLPAVKVAQESGIGLFEVRANRLKSPCAGELFLRVESSILESLNQSFSKQALQVSDIII